MNVAYKDKNYLDVNEAVTSIHDMISDTTMKLFLMADKLIKRRQRGDKTAMEDEEKLQDLQRLFKYQKSVYQDLVKMGLIEKKAANPQLEIDILKGVREQESSIGDIVRKIPGQNK